MVRTIEGSLWGPFFGSTVGSVLSRNSVGDLGDGPVFWSGMPTQESDESESETEFFRTVFCIRVIR